MKNIRVYVIVSVYNGVYDGIVHACIDRDERDHVAGSLENGGYYPDEFTLSVPDEGPGIPVCSIEDFTQDELDELVIDCKLIEASSINNGGREAQLGYLVGG